MEFITSVHQLMSPARKIVGETTPIIIYYTIYRELEDDDSHNECFTIFCETMKVSHSFSLFCNNAMLHSDWLV